MRDDMIASRILSRYGVFCLWPTANRRPRKHFLSILPIQGRSVNEERPKLEELGQVVEDCKGDGGDEEVAMLDGLHEGVADGNVALQRDGHGQVGGARTPNVNKAKQHRVAKKRFHQRSEMHKTITLNLLKGRFHRRFWRPLSRSQCAKMQIDPFFHPQWSRFQTAFLARRLRAFACSAGKIAQSRTGKRIRQWKG
jgi:hypothetical protein